MNPDLLVTGRWLLSLEPGAAVREDAGVLVRGGRIAELGGARALAERHPGVRRLHADEGLVMPGLINTHTHAAMCAFRGLADDLPLMEWLQEHIFPVESRLTARWVDIGARLGICEMIRSGTTTFCDMYLFAREVALAAREAGMRAWVGEVVYDFPSPNYGEPDNGIRYTEALLADFAGDPLVSITVDPHAVYTCSPDLLARLGRLAEDHDALCHIHLSETAFEVENCLATHGRRPPAHLREAGLLNERLLAAHCVHLDQEEMDMLARAGVKVLHCPESNMKLASGAAPVPGLLQAGACVSLGTDGPASNNDLDMFGEMGSAALMHKLHQMDPTVMDASACLDLATRGGARALGREGELGVLRPGALADIIVLDFSAPHLTPVYNPVSHLVYAARGADVVHSVINGQVVMEDRRMVTLDEESIVEDMQRLGREIRAIGA